MAISTLTKSRTRPALRTVNDWVRHSQGSIDTPSQQALESNPRDAYFWRR